MQPFTRGPELSAEARRALEIIVDSTTVDGSTLMKYLGFTRPEDLVPILRELQGNHLVDVGGLLTPDSIPFARVGVRPSAKEFLYSLLR
jgi:hypothetical protein